MSTHPNPTPTYPTERDGMLVVRSVFVVLAAAMLLLVAYAAASTGQGQQARPEPAANR